VHYPDTVYVFLCEGSFKHVSEGHAIRRQELILCCCVYCEYTVYETFGTGKRLVGDYLLRHRGSSVRDW
jgi:hypothetical protein